MSEPTWTGRVASVVVDAVTNEELGNWMTSLAGDMAAILDDHQRQEDEEAGRLLREHRFHVGRRIGFESGYEAATDDWSRFAYGPTHVAALRALRDAIGGDR